MRTWEKGDSLDSTSSRWMNRASKSWIRRVVRGFIHIKIRGSMAVPQKLKQNCHSTQQSRFWVHRQRTESREANRCLYTHVLTAPCATAKRWKQPACPRWVKG